MWVSQLAITVRKVARLFMWVSNLLLAISEPSENSQFQLPKADILALKHYSEPDAE